MKKLIFFITILLLAACSEKRQNEEKEFVTIDLRGLIQTDGKSVLLEDFAKSVTEVPLETNDLCLISDLGTLVFDNERFYINGDKQFYIFDKQGNFLRSFGQKGEGPEEFNRIEHVLVMPEKIVLYDVSKQNMLVYDKEGELREILKVPFQFRTIAALKNGEYIGYLCNYSGQEELHFGIFEPGGEVRDSVFHAEKFEADVAIIFYHEGRFIKRYDEGLLFKEHFNDTIFAIRDTKLQPAYYLELGDRKTSYGDRFAFDYESVPSREWFHMLIPVVFIGETKDYLVFDSKGTILYNKKSAVAQRIKLIYNGEEFIPKFISEDKTTLMGYYEDEENDDNPVLILARI